MSFGLTPYDFVQQVYYVQEGVILDYWPSDDKYKEIIMQGNLILEELQKEYGIEPLIPLSHTETPYGLIEKYYL